MTIEIHSADAPQEDNLADVRRTVEAIASGLADTQSIADRTSRSRRHAGYAINAALVLGWIAEGDEGLSILEPGQALLKEAPGSAGEKAALRAAIERSPALRALAPGLLAATEPTRGAISRTIEALTGLSKSTSERRAQTLLSWRRQVLEAPTAAPSAPPPPAPRSTPPGVKVRAASAAPTSAPPPSTSPTGRGST